jgi:signal transduction histidine kinase
MKGQAHPTSATAQSTWSGLFVGAVAVAVVTEVIAMLDPQVPAPYLLVLYVLVVMVVASIWGTLAAVCVALLSTVVIDYLFVHPAFHLDAPSNLVGLGAFLAAALTVGQLTARLRRAALASTNMSKQEAALRRIATLVAQSAPPPEIFAAVTREVGALCGADLARMERYEPDGTVTGVAAWSRLGVHLSVGTRLPLVGPSIARRVQETGTSQRIRTFEGADGVIAREAQEIGIRSSVGCPITVGGHLWGVIAASTRSSDPFPANTESMIGDFAELSATAVANADSAEKLAASRARVVATADETRRRFERNLHDGAQQRLVAASIYLRGALDAMPPELSATRVDLEKVLNELGESLNELREISRGLHPAKLAEGGLGPALRNLARRSPIPVQVQVTSTNRYQPPLEMAAYCLVSEALTNAAKHAAATQAIVSVDQQDDRIMLCVRDDGVGGADPRGGSGLVGLRDRIEAFGGSIEIISPAGKGTEITASLPVDYPLSDSASGSTAVVRPPAPGRTSGARSTVTSPQRSDSGIAANSTES